jgi:hypothetical protein
MNHALFSAIIGSIETTFYLLLLTNRGRTYMAKKKERQDKSESSPHPRLEALCRETGEALGYNARTKGTQCRP